MAYERFPFFFLARFRVLLFSSYPPLFLLLEQQKVTRPHSTRYDRSDYYYRVSLLYFSTTSEKLAAGLA